MGNDFAEGCLRGRKQSRAARALQNAPQNSSPKLRDVPHKSDVTTNKIIEPVKYRLRPNRDDSHAVIGKTMTLLKI